MCDKHRLRPACAYAQFDQSLCYSLEYSKPGKLLTEQHLEFLFSKGGCIASLEFIHFKMPHCWKSHVGGHTCILKTKEKYSVTDPTNECCCHRRDQIKLNGEKILQKGENLTHLCRMDFPAVINWTSPFPL